MTLRITVKCDFCDKSGPVSSVKSTAIYAAQKQGFKIDRIIDGAMGIDICPKCWENRTKGNDCE